MVWDKVVCLFWPVLVDNPIIQGGLQYLRHDNLSAGDCIGTLLLELLGHTVLQGEGGKNGNTDYDRHQGETPLPLLAVSIKVINMSLC